MVIFRGVIQISKKPQKDPEGEVAFTARRYTCKWSILNRGYGIVRL